MSDLRNERVLKGWLSTLTPYRDKHPEDVSPDDVRALVALLTRVRIETIDECRADVDRALVLASNGAVTPEHLRARLRSTSASPERGSDLQGTPREEP